MSIRKIMLTFICILLCFVIFINGGTAQLPNGGKELASADSPSVDMDDVDMNNDNSLSTNITDEGKQSGDLANMPSQKEENITNNTQSSSQSESDYSYSLKNYASKNNIKDAEIFKRAEFTHLNYSGDTSDMRKIKINVSEEDALEKSGDRKLYIFTVEQRGYIELEFMHEQLSVSTSSPWKMSLYEQYNTTGTGGQIKYRELTYFNPDRDKTSSFSNRVGVYPGTYVIAVTSTGNFSANPYFFTANFVADNYYEAECNDSIYRYNEIYSDKPLYGSSSRLTSGDDYDYFMFEMREDGYVNLNFYHDDLKLPTVAWIITVYDEWGNVVHTGRSSLQDTVIASGALGIKRGIYYIEVVSNIYDAAEYNILLILTADKNFELEENDSFETANTLKKGETIRGALSPRTSPMERDFYKIKLPSRGALFVTFEHDFFDKNDDVVWNVYIYNSKKEMVYRFTSMMMDARIDAPPLGLPAGDYYVCIDSNGNVYSGEIYSLTVDYQTSTNWELEGNDTMATATKLSTSNLAYGSLVNWEDDMFIYDVDYFYFDLSESAKISLQFEHDNLHDNKIGWLITLLGSDENEIISMQSSWNDVSISTNTMSLPSGRYYIKVDTGEWFNSTQYTLKLTSSNG